MRSPRVRALDTRHRLVAEFYTLNHYPSRFNSEHIHLGILVFKADGSVRVHLLDNRERLIAFNPAVNLDALKSLEKDIQQRLEGMSDRDECLTALKAMYGHNFFSDVPGVFLYQDEAEYENRINVALGLFDV